MILNASLPLKRLSGTATDRDTLRVMVFAIADYLFALPFGAVLKVVPCPPISNIVERGIGMADLGSQTVTVVDLHQKFVHPTLEGRARDISSTVSPYRRFLILTQTRLGELCGIPVDQLPTLTDIPLKTVRPVPLSYRQVVELSFASHMAILPQTQGEKSIEIFLLGMSQILANKLGWYRQEVTTSLSDDRPKPDDQRQRFLRIPLGEQGSGLLPLDAVVQVVHVSTPEISPTPALPRWILGLYNWNGQMLRLIDLEYLVGYSPLLQRQTGRNTPKAIVLELQNQVAGFLVSNVYDLEWHDLQQLQPASAALSPSKLQTFVRGALPGDCWVLDLRAIVQVLQWQVH